LAVSMALLILLGLLFDYLFRRMRLPGLVGMLIVGMLCGPHVFNIIQPELFKVSADFRTAALIVILLRAGLKIQAQKIMRMGRPILLMSFVPSTLEGIAIALSAPFLFGMGRIAAAILGFTVAAVSPAVIVPTMIRFADRRRGTNKGIPSLILASSSMDNAYTIVVFSAVLAVYLGTGASPVLKLLDIPISIILGVAVGALLGYVLYRIFERYHLRATKMTMVVISVSMLLIWLEGILKGTIAISPLLGVMTIGFVLLEKAEIRAHKISEKLAKLWIFAEIILFVLVGAQVDIKVVYGAGLAGALLILIGLVARSAGTYIAVMKTDLNIKERLFCVISYIPKATVQAAIGAVPLEAGVKGGDVILAIAVLAIILTAPLGALGTTFAGNKWLTKESTDK
jgi:NhaP-type Na+/H+ or K+/H+ antiporter